MTIDFQDNKGDKIVTCDLSRTAARKKLKTLNFTGKAKNLIVDNEFSKKDKQNESDSAINKFNYPVFVVRKKNNFCLTVLLKVQCISCFLA